MCNGNYRNAIVQYIRNEANPRDKFDHQPRVYQLAKVLAEDQPFDDEVLYAACWLHDIGVFIGHRPEEPIALAKWDNVAYVVRIIPDLLNQWEFPTAKIAHVLDCIRQHLPTCVPKTFEAQLLHDADVLEQLGAIGLVRTISKIGRDTRFIVQSDAISAIRRQKDHLPQCLVLASAKERAKPRVDLLQHFLDEWDNDEKCSCLIP